MKAHHVEKMNALLQEILAEDEELGVTTDIVTNVVIVASVMDMEDGEHSIVVESSEDQPLWIDRGLLHAGLADIDMAFHVELKKGVHDDD